MKRVYAVVCRGSQVPVLFESMIRHCGDFELHTLAWDWDSFELRDPRLKVMEREAFLHHNPDYQRLPGPPRSPVDTVATVRWQFFQDVLEATGQPLTTLDGDMWFWSSPEPMFAEIGRASLAVSPHRIPQAARGLPGVTYETHRQFGLFNAGLVYAADPAPLADMAARTLAWSYTQVRQHPVDGMADFGDQGALERVAAKYGAHVIAHPGANVAPWNVHGHLIVPGAPPSVDGQPLVLYHYSSLRGSGFIANPEYQIGAKQGLLELVYWPYLEALVTARRAL